MAMPMPRVAFKRWLCRAAGAVLCAALLGGCGAGGAERRRDPNTLVALFRADGATMNPLYGQTVQDAIYQGLIFDGLTNIDANYAPVPWLATSWSHSPDGLRWTVELRRGVTWSDGQPFTSTDVVFSYKTMLDPNVAFNGAGDIAYIESVTAEGPHRVGFVLKHPSARFVDGALASPMLPAHLLAKIPPDRQRFSSLGEHPVGTGPYLLERWQHDSQVVFVRNPHWWGGLAKIARFDFRIIFNPQAEVEALEDGSADLIDDLSFDSYRQLQREAPQIKILTFPSLFVDTVEMNLERPGLSEVAVRQAMMYGYNREAVVRGFFDGKTLVADNLVPPALTRWYNPDVKKYPYDPAKARALLDAAGWKLGPDGVRRKDGVKLSLELLVNQGSAFVIDEMLAYQADMRTVGIDVALRQLDFPSLVSRTYSGKYDMIADARGGAIDPDYYSVLHSSQRPPAGANTTGYDNPVVDHDLTMGLRTIDYAKRRVYYDQMQRELAATLPMLWQYTRFAATAYSPRLRLDPKTTLQAPLIWYNVFDWKLAS
jgi:peptide/nickel transport system substrate-binding protein